MKNEFPREGLAFLASLASFTLKTAKEKQTEPVKTLSIKLKDTIATTSPRDIEADKPLPFIDNPNEETGSGCLVIPYGCPDKYKYWAGGQTIWATFRELNTPDFIVQKYVDRKLTPTAYKEWQLNRSTE